MTRIQRRHKARLSGIKRATGLTLLTIVCATVVALTMALAWFALSNAILFAIN